MPSVFFEGGEGWKAVCQDCGWTGPAEDCEAVNDPGQRIAPGEPCPAGECPECGALCTAISPYEQPRSDDATTPVDVKKCGNCGRSWDEKKDPSPGPACHWCNGRGYSTAPIDSIGFGDDDTDDEERNEDRAERGRRVIEYYGAAAAGATDPDDDGAMVRDLLTDLMHFADTIGVDFQTAFITAGISYDEELEEIALENDPPGAPNGL